MVLTHYRKKPR